MGNAFFVEDKMFCHYLSDLLRIGAIKIYFNLIFLYLFLYFYSVLSLILAGSKIYLAVDQITVNMPNLWFRQVPLTMNKSFPMIYFKVYYLDLCNSSIITFDKALKATVCSAAFEIVVRRHGVFMLWRILNMRCFGGHFLSVENYFSCTYGFEILQFQPPCNNQDLISCACLCYKKCVVKIILVHQLITLSLAVMMSSLKSLRKQIRINFMTGEIISFNIGFSLLQTIFHFCEVTMNMMKSKILVWAQWSSNFFKRRHQLEHNNEITGWVLSLLRDIGEEVAERLDCDTRMVIMRIVTKLYVPPFLLWCIVLWTMYFINQSNSFVDHFFKFF